MNQRAIAGACITLNHMKNLAAGGLSRRLPTVFINITYSGESRSGGLKFQQGPNCDSEIVSSALENQWDTIFRLFRTCA
jgi:hypothetical protein